jgi:hypothetical protein
MILSCGKKFNEIAIDFNLRKMKYFNEALNVRKLHNKQIHQTKGQHSIYM